MTSPEIRSYREFWPYYVRAHSKSGTRALHFAGSVLALVFVAETFVEHTAWYLLAALVVGYGFAWIGHFRIEHNRPATFGHPFWSLYSDYRMVALMFAGRMDAEVERCLQMTGDR